MTDPHLPSLDSSDLPQFAALDLGSNSFHLLIARVDNHSLQPLLRLKQRVRMGAGFKHQQLSNKAMQRGLEALAVCAQKLQGFSPEQVRVVATHTFREALNSDIFLAKAASVLAFPIEIISGHEEARLIYTGVAQTTVSEGKRLVIDIGGGSTEFAGGKGFNATKLVSVSMGCISYTEDFFGDGKITRKRFDKALIATRRTLEPVASELRKFAKDQVIGTSGTIRAIAQWAGSKVGQTSHVISREALHSCADELLSHSQLEGMQLAGVDGERVSVIAGGLAILLGLMEELDIDRLEPHDAALREGVLYELAEQVLHHDDVRQRTIESLALRYSIDREQATRVQQTALDLLEQVAKEWRLQDRQWRQLLSWAALLHEVGLQINFSARQRHAGYILQHSDMPGFNKEQQALLAALVRHYRKKVELIDIPELQLYHQHDVLRLLALLRLAVIFNTDRQTSQLLFKTFASKDVLLLTLTPQGRANPTLIADLAAETKQLIKLGITLRWE